jgi:hypothetical protein
MEYFRKPKVAPPSGDGSDDYEKLMLSLAEKYPSFFEPMLSGKLPLRPVLAEVKQALDDTFKLNLETISYYVRTQYSTDEKQQNLFISIQANSYMAVCISWLIGMDYAENDPELYKKLKSKKRIGLEDVPSDAFNCLSITVLPMFGLFRDIFTDYYDSRYGERVRFQKELHLKDIYQSMMNVLLKCFLDGIKSIPERPEYEPRVNDLPRVDPKPEYAEFPQTKDREYSPKQKNSNNKDTSPVWPFVVLVSAAVIIILAAATNSQSSYTTTANVTPPQAATIQPTQVRATSLIRTPTRFSPTVTSSSCRFWSDVTYLDEGKTLCVYGTVKDAYFGGDIYYLKFSNDANAFRFIVQNDYYFKEVKGKCVENTGIVKVYDRMPYISLGEYINFCL